MIVYGAADTDHSGIEVDPAIVMRADRDRTTAPQRKIAENPVEEFRCRRLGRRHLVNRVHGRAALAFFGRGIAVGHRLIERHAHPEGAAGGLAAMVLFQASAEIADLGIGKALHAARLRLHQARHVGIRCRIRTRSHPRANRAGSRGPGGIGQAELNAGGARLRRD